jgi:hypothetical protein
MRASLDQLARNLASGVSRRKALWQFVGGLGILGALTGRKASASGFGGRRNDCLSFCREQAEFIQRVCEYASESCSQGSCAELSLTGIGINGTGILNFDGAGSQAIGINGFGINGSPFICVPLYGNF